MTEVDQWLRAARCRFGSFAQGSEHAMQGAEVSRSAARQEQDRDRIVETILPSQEVPTGWLPSWLHPHIEAIKASRQAGFGFRFLPSLANLSELQGFHSAFGALDIYIASSPTDTVAARFRLEDLETGRKPAPLWHRHGTVTNVVTELLELPAHGSPGAPQRALAAVTDLWLPL